MKESGATAEVRAAALALHAMLVSHRFILLECAFNDMLQKLAMLSKLFQYTRVSYTTIKVEVAATRASLQSCYLATHDEAGRFPRPMAGSTYVQLSSTSQHAAQVARGLKEGSLLPTFTFHGLDVKYEPGQVTQVEAAVRSFAQTVYDNLAERFPHNDVLAALEIFDPTQMPVTRAEWDGQRALYGLEEMHTLFSQFGMPRAVENGAVMPAIVRRDRLDHEWEVCRERLWQSWQDHLLLEPMLLAAEAAKGASVSAAQREVRMAFTDQVWKSIFQTGMYPEVATLAKLWCIVCHSTVPCERGFSDMALIKTRLRNRLNVPTLDDLMQISSDGPPMSDHDGVCAIIKEAYLHWIAARKRNMMKSHPGVAGRRRMAASKSAEVSALDREREEAERDLPSFVKEMRGLAPGDGKELEGDGEEDVESSPTTNTPSEGEEDLYAGVPPYPTLLHGAQAADWVVQATPDADWDPAAISWTNQRIAHKWADGW